MLELNMTVSMRAKRQNKTICKQSMK